MGQQQSDAAIRSREAADLDGCVQVLAAVHAADNYPLRWPADPAAWLEPSTQLAAWVAEIEGSVVGHVSLSRGRRGNSASRTWAAHCGADPEQSAVVGRLFIAPDARGRRLGKRLLAQAAAAAAERGARAVLDVAATDRAAMALYRRSGWVCIGTATEHLSNGEAVELHCFTTPDSLHTGHDTQRKDP